MRVMDNIFKNLSMSDDDIDKLKTERSKRLSIINENARKLKIQKDLETLQNIRFCDNARKMLIPVKAKELSSELEKKYETCKAYLLKYYSEHDKIDDIKNVDFFKNCVLYKDMKWLTSCDGKSKRILRSSDCQFSREELAKDILLKVTLPTLPTSQQNLVYVEFDYHTPFDETETDMMKFSFDFTKSI